MNREKKWVWGFVILAGALGIAWWAKADVRWDMYRTSNASPEVRMAAVHHLAQAGSRAAIARPKLIQLLGDPDPRVAGASLGALQTLGFTSDIVPALAAILRENRSAQSRVDAIGLIARLGPEGQGAVPELTECLDDTRQAMRLFSTSPFDVPVIPPTLGRLAPGIGIPTVRQSALDALAAIGPAARPAVPKIVELLPKSDLAVSMNFSLLGSGGEGQQAIKTLGAIGPGAEEAVPALLALLEQKYSLRPSLLPSLGGVDQRQHAESAVNACRAAAASALGGIGSKTALPPLKDAMKDDNAEVRIAAAMAVWKIDPAAANEVRGTLGPLAGSSNEVVAQMAAEALSTMRKNPVR